MDEIKIRVTATGENDNEGKSLVRPSNQLTSSSSATKTTTTGSLNNISGTNLGSTGSSDGLRMGNLENSEGRKTVSSECFLGGTKSTINSLENSSSTSKLTSNSYGSLPQEKVSASTSSTTINAMPTSTTTPTSTSTSSYNSNSSNHNYSNKSIKGKKMGILLGLLGGLIGFILCIALGDDEAKKYAGIAFGVTTVAYIIFLLIIFSVTGVI